MAVFGEIFHKFPVPAFRWNIRVERIPSGQCHTDLFRHQVRFKNEVVTVDFSFYFKCMNKSFRCPEPSGKFVKQVRFQLHCFVSHGIIRMFGEPLVMSVRIENAMQVACLVTDGLPYGVIVKPACIHFLDTAYGPFLVVCCLFETFRHHFVDSHGCDTSVMDQFFPKSEILGLSRNERKHDACFI